jgi:hypothetical protein
MIYFRLFLELYLVCQTWMKHNSNIWIIVTFTKLVISVMGSMAHTFHLWINISHHYIFALSSISQLKSATSIQYLFLDTWLARYPWPQFIVFDNGSMSKFKCEFKQMCMQDNYGIKAIPTTSHNQQNTRKCNHWESTQGYQSYAQMIWLGKQSRKSRRTIT